MNYDANALEVSQTSDNSSAPENIYYRKKADGQGAERVYLDAGTGEEKIENIPSSTAWNDLGWIKNYFSHSEFLEDEGNTYRYTGNQKNEIINALSKIDVSILPNATIDSLTLTVSADRTRIESLKALSLPFDSGTDTGTTYEIDITIAPTATAPTAPGKPSVPDTTVNGQIFGSLGTLNQAYRARTTNDLNPNDSVETVVNTEIIYTKKTIGSTITETGWFKVENGWVEFTINNNGAVAITQNSFTTTQPVPKTVLGINLNPDVFIKNGSTLTPAKYIAEVGQNLPYKLADANAIVGESLTITTDASNRIEKFVYNFTSDSGLKEETVSFDRSPSGAKINDTLREKIRLAADAAAPGIISWKQETEQSENPTNNNINSLLLDLFKNQTVVDTLPYPYSRETARKWVGTYNGFDAVTVRVPNTANLKQQFITDYTKQLLDNGFNKEFNTERYYKDGVYAQILTENGGAAINDIAIRFGNFISSWRGYSAKYNVQIENDLFSTLDPERKDVTILDQIPYISVADTFSGNVGWKSRFLDGTTLSFEDSNYGDEKFVTDYAKLLTDAGYTHITGNEYHNEKIHIEIKTTVTEGNKHNLGILVNRYTPVPTNWQDENTTLYNELLSYFYNDQNAVGGIPYLYLGNTGVSPNWQATTQAGTYRLAPRATGSYDTTKFLSEYSALLTDLQYARQGQTNTYIKGIVSITIDPSVVALTLKRIPTSWQLLDSNNGTGMYQSMVAVLGSNAVVDTVPYLYTEGVSEKFASEGEIQGQQVDITAKDLTQAVAEKYRTDYIALLRTNSYTITTNNNGTTTATKGTVSIQIGGGNDRVVLRITKI